ncbi:GlxA family transcriptional regulator [Streptomyces seoulensis]|uniref:AraC family transcriptional regulator n=1 Tax=Streptomyces seoulensis TaxID=73044 RepID=A0A4P6TQU6_STRSO|nr:helix-turn-helix domain-containing protein [Streptomyces seoulensis]QBJ88903.1 AraC family transcriptional regulator [Streptomyces seoulensis]
MDGEKRHQVVVLVRAGLIPMELGIVHRLFTTATDSGGRALYSVRTCATAPGVVPTDTDIGIQVPYGPEILREADTVVVPAAVEDYRPQKRGRLDPEVRRALALVPEGARLASICTGAFVLAAAGHLDGRRATTHWKSCAELAALYPGTEVDPGVLYTDDDGVLTSAGVAAGVDLCLHMIRDDHGAEVANAVARDTVVPPHREGGQAQYIERPVPRESDPSPTAAARAYALEHIGEPLTLDDLARRAGISVRTLSRRFRRETGATPMRWLAEQRLDHARRLLERTDHPVDRVAADAGYGTGTAMRLRFREVLGVSPRAYRNAFRVRGGTTP